MCLFGFCVGPARAETAGEKIRELRSGEEQARFQIDPQRDFQ